MQTTPPMASGTNTANQAQFEEQIKTRLKIILLIFSLVRKVVLGPKVSIHKAILLSALTLKQTEADYNAQAADKDWSEAD